MPHRASSQKHSYFMPRLLFGFLLVTTAALFAFILASEARRWDHATPSFVVKGDSWRVSTTRDGLETTTKYRDPKLGSGLPGETGINEYWIGTSVSRTQGTAIRQTKANNLILGWIKGDYEIWLNDDYFTGGNRSDREPIVLTLPFSLLKEKLDVSIKIRPEPGAAISDVLANPLNEGFATREESSAFKSLSNFWKKSRPLALFFMNLIIAGAFYLLWHSEKRKQEFFYIAVYGLICALFQLRLSDLYLNVFEPNVNYSIDVFLRFSEGAFGMFLGFAFARTKRRYFKIMVPMALATPIFIAIYLKGGLAKYAFNSILDQWVSPIFYITGAIACFSESIYLSRGSHKGVAPHRVRHLLLFAVALLAIGAIGWLQSHQLMSFVQRALVSRFAHFGLVMFLGYIALLEYREQKQLVEQTPVSRYHRWRVLPESLTGALLVADLKNSEFLFRSRAEGTAENLVETALSHMWGAITDHKGIILRTNGDELKAFFDEKLCKDPVISAVRATDEMAKRLAVLTERYRELEALTPAQGLHFRAGISYGQIKPIWQEIDGVKYASWTETGDTTPLVECARMMETERLVDDVKRETAVILPEGLARHSENWPKNLTGRWLFKNRRFKGKHDRIYAVAAYLPYAKSSVKNELDNAA